MSELLEKILSRDNMNAAYKKVCANKGAGGVDEVTTEQLGDYIKKNWDGIREQIRNREYKPRPVRRAEIPKPDGGVRKLGIPTVMDRGHSAGNRTGDKPDVRAVVFRVELRIQTEQKLRNGSQAVTRISERRL